MRLAWIASFALTLAMALSLCTARGDDVPPPAGVELDWLTRPEGVKLDFQRAMPVVRGQSWSETIETDRPDFTESSSTVGRGRFQIEAGYTYAFDDEGDLSTDIHTLPEILFRWGLTDWFELRLDWEGYGAVRVENRATGFSESIDGVTDLGAGCKVEIMPEQAGFIPQTAFITSLTAPVGSEDFTSDQVDVVLNLVYSWDVLDWLSIGASTGNTWAAVEEDQFSIFHQSLTAAYSLTERVGAFTEWFVLVPRWAEINDPEHYFNGGFTFLVTPDFQLDWRAGLGLNEAALDYFTGTGLAVRY